MDSQQSTSCTREVVFQDPTTKWAYSDEKWHRGCYYLYHNYRDWTLLNSVPCIAFHNVFMEYEWLEAISPNADRLNETAKSIRRYMLQDETDGFFFKSLRLVQSAALKNIDFHDIQPLLPPRNYWNWYCFVLPHIDELRELYAKAYPIYREYGPDVEHRSIPPEDVELYVAAEYIL
ncbi:hypothetical protein TKK_0000320 [Trichogramma kaykai]|uniref:Uncharacterized protein n=1 Tax=Trichogramma kaykai TaxID=54128 RepID=A0ABD2W790_9HYME